MQSTNSNYSPVINNNVSYVDLANTTAAPNAPISVYKVPQLFQNAVNMNLLNPHQNDPSIVGRTYYTISTAYGGPPDGTQQKRSCTGGF